MTMIRQILAGAALLAALASPALADEAEDIRNVRLVNYSMALAESFGQMVGIAAQCYGGISFIAEGRVAVLDALQHSLNANGLNRAAETYDRGVQETRLQYSKSCDGAAKQRQQLYQAVERYQNTIKEMIGYDEKTGTLTNPSKRP